MRNPLFNGVTINTRMATNPGESLARIFEPFFNGSTTVLKEVGKRNIQELMDAQAPQCDIAYMLTRLKAGDSSVLSSSTPLFGDFSELSHNPADVLNLTRNAELSFGSLSKEERVKYNNDWRVYFSSLLAGISSGDKPDLPTSIPASGDSDNSVVVSDKPADVAKPVDIKE